MCLEFVGAEQIVGIEKGHELAVNVLHAVGAGDADATVVLLQQHDSIVVGQQRIHQSGGIVAAAIIDDDQFPVLMALRLHRCNGFNNSRLRIERGHDHTDQAGHASVWSVQAAHGIGAIASKSDSMRMLAPSGPRFCSASDNSVR